MGALYWFGNYPFIAESESAHYQINGVTTEYWVSVTPKDSIPLCGYNLGWAPTLKLAKKRCRDLDDYLEKRYPKEARS